MIDQAVPDLLVYEPETGVLRWRKNRGGGVKRGNIAGCLDKEGYVVLTILKRQYRAHRVAWFLTHGAWEESIDHIDGVRSNNRLSNLRPATQAHQCQNRRTAGRYLKGAHFNKRDRLWTSRITQNGQITNLGCFKTEAEAHAAYCAAARKLFGEFAWP